MRTRLLERIAYLEEPNPTGVVVSTEAGIKRSVIHYLECLLNTRRGEVPIDSYYGLPGMANIAGSLKSDSNENLEQNIVEQIQLYEKRFAEPTITQVFDERDVIAFCYELHGMINVSFVEVLMRPLVLALKLHSNGRITLEEKRGF